MCLTEYFYFIADNDISSKGTIIGLYTILYDYIYDAQTPE